jgi:hypothetical protein
VKKNLRNFKKSEYRAMLKDLYTVAEMFWRNRRAGTVAVEQLKKICEMTGLEYVPGPFEKEDFESYQKHQ